MHLVREALESRDRQANASFVPRSIDRWVAVDEPITNLNEAVHWQGRRYIHQQFCTKNDRLTTYTQRALPPELPRRQSISERRATIIDDE